MGGEGGIQSQVFWFIFYHMLPSHGHNKFQYFGINQWGYVPKIYLGWQNHYWQD